jgi:arginyl-tRNA synthetase
MNTIQQIQQNFSDALSAQFGLVPALAAKLTLDLNLDEHKQAFGDLTTNAAMVLAKELKKSPREVATTIVNSFKDPRIARMEIAGPGFINFFLAESAWSTIAQEYLARGADAFKPASLKTEHINIEFVSANPTGPLHFGHGRGGILGDVIARVLSFLGHTVQKEFYINDAGAQIQKLGISFKIRCQQQVGQSIELPEDAYHGDYLVELATQCLSEHGEAILKKPSVFFEEYAQDHMLAAIKETLASYGITYDVWFSEKTLHTSGAIEHALNVLAKRGMLYDQDGATWFKATQFGDDKDRVVKKSDGSLTYIAADVAYLLSKTERGNNHLIMILGHDHHSYATRLEAVRQGLGLNDTKLDVVLYQLVQIKSGNMPVKMSKRAGNIITLKDVIETVGPDVARFFYLHRKADAQLEFDLDLARTQSDENPVYYVQYAYVRTNSILDKAEQELVFASANRDDCKYLGTAEALLLKKIASLGPLLELIGTNYQTHLLTHYVVELANLFHKYYAANRVLDTANINLSKGRIQMIKLVQHTFRMAFELIGISAPQRM